MSAFEGFTAAELDRLLIALADNHGTLVDTARNCKGRPAEAYWLAQAELAAELYQRAHAARERLRGVLARRSVISTLVRKVPKQK